MLLLEEIRSQFPILGRKINGHPLVYLDNAASSQKPLAVIDAISHYYKTFHSNVHRGAHTLAQEATVAYENCRNALATYLNVSNEEIVFTKGTTEALNLVAYSWVKNNLKEGDIMLVSEMEHHANLVPYQIVAKSAGFKILPIPINDKGEIILEAYRALLSPKVKCVAFNHVSNSLGTINPVKEMIAEAHRIGAIAIVDGAQAIPHLQPNLKDLDADFYAFSSHKMYGPTGVGILYGKKHLLDSMPPFMGGGEMIKEVSFAGTTFNEAPHIFEPGTPNIADIIALHAALKWIQSVGIDTIARQEQTLLSAAQDILTEIPGLKVYGTANAKVGVLSFLIEGVHPSDIGFMLDAKGIAVRTGHHCTQPLMKKFGINGTVRASFAVYNTLEEVEYFAKSLKTVCLQLR